MLWFFVCFLWISKTCSYFRLGCATHFHCEFQFKQNLLDTLWYIRMHLVSKLLRQHANVKWCVSISAEDFRTNSRPGTIPVPEGAKDIAALTRPNTHLQRILLCSFTGQMVLLESMGKSDHFKSTLLKKTSEFRLGFPDGDSIIMVHKFRICQAFHWQNPGVAAFLPGGQRPHGLPNLTAAGESSLDLPNTLKSLALESWLTPDEPRLLCEQARSGLEKNKLCPYQLSKTARN